MRTLIHCGHLDVIWYDPNISMGYDSDPCPENDVVFVVPNSVEIIRSGAFALTDLHQTIIIPSTVKSIEKFAFLECPLQSIILPYKVDIDPEAFVDRDLKCTRFVEKIFVPKGSLLFYRSKLPYDLDRIYELENDILFT